MRENRPKQRLPNELRIWVSRPSDTLCKKIVEQGGTAYHLPVLKIEPIVPSISFISFVNCLSASDWLIFVSVNAVQNAMYGQLGQVIKKMVARVAAVGPATASALEKYGIAVSARPVLNFNSEELLALPVFQQLKGCQIGIVSGEGGRNLLESTCRERGASVSVIRVYRRSCADVSYKNWQALCTYAPQVVVVTSVDLFHCLLHVINRYKYSSSQLTGLTWLVASERIAQAMRQYCCEEKLIIANNATNDALIDALLCQRVKLRRG